MLVTGIGRLVTNDPELGPGLLGVIENAALVVAGGRVTWVGPATSAPEGAGDVRLDVDGRCVVPGFVDAHTHLVFAGERAAEFEARMAGVAYDGGGIVETVRATRAASDAALQRVTAARAREALGSGTTTIEVKSGYGLAVAEERRLLDVAASLAGPDAPEAVPTFLGAHTVPPEFAERRDAYVELVATDMLTACAPAARWCDVFCERGAFDADEARTILTAAAQRGLGLRIHANQLGPGPGAQLAAELGAASADHVTHLDDRDIAALRDAGVVATLLPSAELGTRSPPAPARRLLAAGVPVALATDCNPGTSYVTSMPLVIALGCLWLGLTPDEAVHAATAGGAAALRLDDAGFLRPGSRPDLVVLEADRPSHLAYRPGAAIIRDVVRSGALVGREVVRG